MCDQEALREHKPPPIRRIRILDFGLPDPKRDPDHHQNCITWSLSHAPPLQKISSKSVHKFASNPTHRQTNRQTDRTKNITSFFGGGNKSWCAVQYSSAGHCVNFTSWEGAMTLLPSVTGSVYTRSVSVLMCQTYVLL